MSHHPLLRPLAELEQEYKECVRHLPADVRMMIESSRQLPPEYAGKEYFKIQCAHALCAQIRARKEMVNKSKGPDFSAHLSV